jgi:hypothetical protein
MSISRASIVSTAFSNCAVTFTQSSSTVPLKSAGSLGDVTMMRVVYGAVFPAASTAVPETNSSCSSYPNGARS